MLFIENKYTKTYYKIIDNAKSKDIAKSIERHHIIPRSLGGSNQKDNIVLLTPREHFICHLLLVKMTSGLDKAKMSYAVWRLAHSKHFSVTNSKTYEFCKTSIREANKLTNNKPPNHFGKKIHDIVKDKSKLEELSAKRRAAMLGKNNPRFGVKLTDEQKEKMRAGQKPKTEEQKQHISSLMLGKSWEDRYGIEGAAAAKEKVSLVHKGKPKSLEHRKKLSEINLGKVGIQHTDKTKMLLSARRKSAKFEKCKYCNKEMHPSHISRYHNDKCKLKP